MIRDYVVLLSWLCTVNGKEGKPGVIPPARGAWSITHLVCFRVFLAHKRHPLRPELLDPGHRQQQQRRKWVDLLAATNYRDNFSKLRLRNAFLLGDYEPAPFFLKNNCAITGGLCKFRGLNIWKKGSSALPLIDHRLPFVANPITGRKTFSRLMRLSGSCNFSRTDQYSIFHESTRPRSLSFHASTPPWAREF